MDYYVKLLKMGCFSREDVAALTHNIRTADTLLYTYKKRGWITDVRKNYYVAVNLETGTSVCNSFEIASGITADACVSHHTAFEYYGLTNQVFADVYVTSAHRFRSFDFDGRYYRRVSPKINLGIRQSGRIRVTDLERTIADNIKDFDKIGGLEELLRCLSMITVVNEENLIAVLTAFDNQFLWQKAGFFCTFFLNMKLSPKFFELCRKEYRKSCRYLYEDCKNESPVLDVKWNLYVPRNIEKLLDKGGLSFV